MNLFKDTSSEDPGESYVPLFRLPGNLSEFLEDSTAENWSGSANIVVGYSAAATALYSHMLQKLEDVTMATDVHYGVSSLISPYLFLWRHHLELSMKSCLRALLQNERSHIRHDESVWQNLFSAEVKVDDGVMRKHSVAGLWAELERYSRDVWGVFGGGSENLPKLNPDAASCLLRQT